VKLKVLVVKVNVKVNVKVKVLVVKVKAVVVKVNVKANVKVKAAVVAVKVSVKAAVVKINAVETFTLFFSSPLQRSDDDRPVKDCAFCALRDFKGLQTVRSVFNRLSH
jgi:hypothetical protein